MKFRSLFTLIALFLCAGLMAQSVPDRTTQRAKNRAENRANQRVDQKVDKAVDSAFNAVGNLFKKKKKATAEAAAKTRDGGAGSNNEEEYTDEDEAAQAISNIMGGNSDPWEPYTNPHNFSLRMEITEVKKNGKRLQNAIEMAVTTDHFAIRMEDEDRTEVSRMILNTQDGKTTMITTAKNGEQTGFRMRMPGMRKAMQNAAEDVTDRYTVTATGERKVIDGYNCEKYIIKDTKENIDTESWVTNDITMNAQDIFGGMMGMFGAGKQHSQGATNSLAGSYRGFPIMTISTDGKSTFEAHYKNIRIGEDKVDKSILSISGIQIQELGF